MRQRHSIMLAAALATSALALGGCGLFTHTSKTTGPDGKPAFALNCPNAAACYARDGKLCLGKGYTIEEQSGDPEGYGSGRSRADIANLKESHTEMLIECKP